MGYQTILSAGWYLDLMYPASLHYAVDPLSGESAALTPQEKERIVGGEAAPVDGICDAGDSGQSGLAANGGPRERLWSPAWVTDPASMYRRLAVLSRNLEWLGLSHRTHSQRMIERIAGDAPLELLETLAKTLEPVKEYDRGKTQSYSTLLPLNRLVDAIPPESEPAREFNVLAQNAEHDPASRPELRKQLMQWRDNDGKLQPFLPESAFLADLAPLSHDISALATVGLEALDAIDSGQPVAPEKRTEQLALVNAAAAAAHAEMMIVIIPGIRHLVEAQP